MYLLAAEVGVHPSNFSGILRGRLPLRADVAARIRERIEREVGDGQ